MNNVLNKLLKLFKKLYKIFNKLLNSYKNRRYVVNAVKLWDYHLNRHDNSHLHNQVIKKFLLPINLAKNKAKNLKNQKKRNQTCFHSLPFSLIIILKFFFFNSSVLCLSQYIVVSLHAMRECERVCVCVCFYIHLFFKNQ